MQGCRMKTLTARADNGETGHGSPAEALAREMDTHATRYQRMTEELGSKLQAEKTRLRTAWTAGRRPENAPPTG